MSALDDALRNIDVFCKVFVKKMLEDEGEYTSAIEPMESLLRKKAASMEKADTVKTPLIPLPHIEEPLIDVFEEEDKIKVLMQCRCRDHKIVVKKVDDDLQICIENECWMIALPNERLLVDNISMKCNNNSALEIAIPKAY